MPRAPEPYSTEYLLLGLIQANPIHPYDLHKQLSSDADLRLIWRINQSQLYATVDKLEKAGGVDCKKRSMITLKYCPSCSI